MANLLQTAERVAVTSNSNSYILSRHIFAYMEAKKHIGNVVLELGCGDGYGMSILSKDCISYTAVDKSTPQKLSLNEHCSFFNATLPNLYYIGDNSYDTVICFQVIEHIKDDEKLLTEIYRILKPGGKLILTTPNINTSLTKNPFHIREYSESTMKSIFSKAFTKFNIQGVFGNKKVKDYYENNKRSVEKITKWDIFNLQYRLPSVLLRIPYSILNNLNRKKLSQGIKGESTSFDYTDFYNDANLIACLDFFVVAEK